MKLGEILIQEWSFETTAPASGNVNFHKTSLKQIAVTFTDYN